MTTTSAAFVNDSALCAQVGDADSIFFPHRGSSPRQAKALCATCPLLPPCREYALTQPPDALFGVWGGLTQRDRRAVAA